MRTWLLIPLMIFSSTQVQAQFSDKSIKLVKNYPVFEGGIAGFYKYVGKTMKYPKRAKRDGVEGKVMVSFLINEQGVVIDSLVSIAQGIHPLLDNEAIRILKKCPNWIPATYEDGEPVAIEMAIPIIFVLRKKIK